MSIEYRLPVELISDPDRRYSSYQQCCRDNRHQLGPHRYQPDPGLAYDLALVRVERSLVPSFGLELLVQVLRQDLVDYEYQDHSDCLIYQVDQEVRTYLGSHPAAGQDLLIDRSGKLGRYTLGRKAVYEPGYARTQDTADKGE